MVGALLAVAAVAFAARRCRRRSAHPGRLDAAAESEAARAEAERISGSAAGDLALLRRQSARGATQPNPAFDADTAGPHYEEVLPEAVSLGPAYENFQLGRVPVVPDDEGALDDESQLLYELLRVAQQSAHSDCMY